MGDITFIIKHALLFQFQVFFLGQFIFDHIKVIAQLKYNLFQLVEAYILPVTVGLTTYQSLQLRFLN